MPRAGKARGDVAALSAPLGDAFGESFGEPIDGDPAAVGERVPVGEPGERVPVGEPVPVGELPPGGELPVGDKPDRRLARVLVEDVLPDRRNDLGLRGLMIFPSLPKSKAPVSSS